MVWYWFVGVLIRLFLLISLDGWMENGRTRPLEHDHATDYWIKNTRIPQDTRLVVSPQNEKNNDDDDNNKKKIIKQEKYTVTFHLVICL